MALHRSIDPSDPRAARPLSGLGGRVERRRTATTGLLAVGTLACPNCDAPLAPGGVLSPSDTFGCGFCRHTGALRDFLSLAAPARPARVEVRVVRGD